MEQHDFLQGSPEWHAHRATHFNASDAPAMLGVSPYKTRGQLMEEMHTGITPDVDASTQRRFDEGHRFEALARPLAAKIIGKKLYPVVGSDGKYSASFDGLTMDDSINFEHKSLNDELRAVMVDGYTGADLPLLYRGQMEQQHKVSGAEKTLFMASKWERTDEVTEHFIEDENGYVQYYKLIEERHCWYEPDLELREKIIAAWDQFEKDLAEFVPVEVIPAAVAKPTLDFPVPSIELGGSITLKSNMTTFGEKLKAYIAALPEKPSNDQEFADCKAALSKLKSAEEALDSEEARALAQLTEIDAMRREKKLYSDLARTTRLALEKLVTAQETAIKAKIVLEGKEAFAAHMTTLNTQLGKPYMPEVPANFTEVIKNKRTIASLQSAVSDELARVKIVANDIAGKIQVNLNSLRELAKDHAFLFADTAQLVMKSNDDLIVLIKMRISEHAQAEEKRQEEERQRIRAEEEQRAKDKVEAERLAAEKKAQEEADAASVKSKPAEAAPIVVAAESVSHPEDSAGEPAAPMTAAPVTRYFHGTKPTAQELVDCISTAFKAPQAVALRWLRETDYSEVELKKAA